MWCVQYKQRNLVKAHRTTPKKTAILGLSGGPWLRLHRLAAIPMGARVPISKFRKILSDTCQPEHTKSSLARAHRGASRGTRSSDPRTLQLVMGPMYKKKVVQELGLNRCTAVTIRKKRFDQPPPLPQKWYQATRS